LFPWNEIIGSSTGRVRCKERLPPEVLPPRGRMSYLTTRHFVDCPPRCPPRRGYVFGFPRFLRIESPCIATRCASWTSRSRDAVDPTGAIEDYRETALGQRKYSMIISSSSCFPIRTCLARRPHARNPNRP
jgi:hypothetical protein